jgi:phosphatidylserine decarboxylase
MTFIEPLHYSFYAPELYIALIVLLLLSYKYKIKILYAFVFLIFLLIVFFYRSNSNPINTQKNIIVSPCEGKILKIINENNVLFVSVFLNIHNVHIQYFPCDGTIIKKEYKSGEFHPAYMFEKSKYNEQLKTTLSTEYGQIQINQIAGLIARRIVSFHQTNDNVVKGEPLGMIKFGSRVDLGIHSNRIKTILIKEGELIKIGDAICEII